MIKKLFHCLLRAVIPGAIIYCASIAVLKLAGFGIMEIVRDPAQEANQSAFLGFISNIGSWMWVSSAAICFFVSFAYSPDAAHRKELLLLVGALSMILAIDDFFLIHDRYINEKICYLGYAVSVGALLLRYYRTIIEIDPVALLLSGLLLALSILTDLVQSHLPMSYNVVQFFEEGFKFTGGAAWLYFCCRIASSPASSPHCH